MVSKMGGVQKKVNKADLATVLERCQHKAAPWQVSRNLDLGRAPSSLMIRVVYCADTVCADTVYANTCFLLGVWNLRMR